MHAPNGRFPSFTNNRRANLPAKITCPSNNHMVTRAPHAYDTPLN